MHQINIFQPGSGTQPEDEQTIEALCTQLSDYLPQDQVTEIEKAYYYAKDAHEGQTRKSGEPYITHPLAVAYNLAELQLDHQSLMAALLHDVIEDTEATKEDIANEFGDTVADLVDGVSKLTQIEFQSKAEAQAENFQKMALAMAEDIRVILVKLADRLHNMRTLGALRPDKKRRIAKETLEIYAPIAQRLGMHKMRVEFEELGFFASHPMRAERIRRAVNAARKNRKELLQNIRTAIESRLEGENYTAQVDGREKHLYSIYRKMKDKRKSFSEIMDIFAFRIVVKDVDTCYRVLGCVHSLFKPVHGEFSDYIAIPKANGYQSLHTVLFGMHGVPIEIQIRTEEMEDMANHGIAAHWLYKSDGDPALSGSHARARRWVQGLLELQQRAGDSLEFIENVKIDLFPDEVYVFTPGGDILELPQGSTAVDLAYAIHTDVGNSCVACRINRRLSPLSEQLKSGQTVQIVTAPGATPNAAWLNFVVTAKARTNIRHFLKQQRQEDAITLGSRLLDKALNTLSTSLDKITDEQKARMVTHSDGDTFDHVLEAIGLGNRLPFLAAQQLLALESDEGDESPLIRSDHSSLVIRGTEGFLVNFARCCFPLPGDPIIGHISSEKGIVVHTTVCHNSAESSHDRQRWVNLSWHEQVAGEFGTELRVKLVKSRGSIATLATRITSLDANIERISVEDKDPHISIIHLVINVHSRVHVARIIKKLRAVPEVKSVSRVRH